MTAEDRPGLRFLKVDPRSPDAIWAMEQYFAELDRRFEGGFDPGDTLEADAHQMEGRSGAFFVAYDGDRPVGCGGLQTIDRGVGEIKRMWVAPDMRGRGVARAILDTLELNARGIFRHRIVRLDTHSSLPEAVALYRSCGYTEVERYNDNPYPDHFFEKRLR